MHSHSELKPQALNDILQSADELPPVPMSYNEYVERRLKLGIRKAYADGFDRGRRHQVLVLFIGMLFGCVLGFYIAVTR
jgi:hypothetical protein